jgi:hypothetical protein
MPIEDKSPFNEFLTVAARKGELVNMFEERLFELTPSACLL